MLVTELCPTLCDPMGFPGGSNGKEYASSVIDLGLIPGLGRSPGGGHGNPLWYSCLENLHGQKSLMGYSPWGHTESDTTEQLNADSSVHGILQARILEWEAIFFCRGFSGPRNRIQVSCTAGRFFTI